MLARTLLLIAVVIWGWTFVATKVLVEEIGPVEIFGLRLALGVPFLALVLLAKRVPVRFEREDRVPLLAGGAIFAFHFMVQIRGMETTSATNTGWILSISPLAIVLLSYLFLGERLGPRGVAGVAVATSGIVLLVSRGNLATLDWLRSTGDWLVLASAVTWALYTVVIRNLARRRDPLAVAFGILSVSALLMAVMFVATADLDAIRSLSPRGLVAVVYLGIPGLAIGQWFWQEGIAALGASRASLFLYLEPIFTLTLAIPLLGESFGPVAAIGAALVLAGVWLGQQASSEAVPPPEPPEQQCAADRRCPAPAAFGSGVVDQSSDTQRGRGGR